MLRWLTVHSAYGEGFRSPQARTLDDGEQTPFAKVRSADIGARASVDEVFEISVSGYHTRLSDDGSPEGSGAATDGVTALPGVRVGIWELAWPAILDIALPRG